MATEQVRALTIDTQAAQTSVKELRKELKALKDTLLSTEQGTDEYNKAMSRAAEIQHTLKEQMEEVNARAMDFGQIASNCTKAVGGLVGGLQAAKATMTLFGVENETVLKSLQKMQSLMAITQALPALDNGVKAFKRLSIAIKGTMASLNGLKAALVSTGIGALIVALGLLAANWDKVTDAMRKWGLMSEDTEKKMQKQIELLDKWKGKLNDINKKIYDKETAAKVAKMNEDAKKQFNDLADEIDMLSMLQQKLEAEMNIEWDTNGNSIKAREMKVEFDELTQSIDNLHKKQRELLDDANSYKELPKTIGKAVDESKQKVSELEILMWEAIQKMTPSSLQEELLAKFGGSGIVIPVKLEIDEEEEEDTSFEDNFRKKIEDTIQSLRDAFKTPEEQYAQEINALEVALNTKLIKEEEYLKLRDALNKEQAQREVQRYTTAAMAIGDIFSSLGDLMEEGSKEQKALQIMGATINMLAGITSAIAGAFTTHSGPWDIALAAIQAVAIAASGAATIAKMSKTNKNNAKSMSSGAANTGAINNIIAPVQYTQDVQGAAIEGAIADSRVYVVEQDITDTQNKVHVTEQEATY